MVSRAAEVPDTGLPIEAAIGDVREALATHRRVVLQAEPGAGKTTVVPLRLINEDWLAGRRIVMLEPRRLAARAAAQRMASLLGERLGETVGVVTRDLRKVSDRTRIEVVTEGILTRRLQSDPGLTGVGLVIFDEFHERNLQGDLGLAFLLDAISALELDIAIMVMSATLDGQRVSRLLAGGSADADSADSSDNSDSSDEATVPVVNSPGRAFPVEVVWRPRSQRDRLEPAAADAIRWALANETGDVLVFLPGMGEINRTSRALGSLPGVNVHLLHGSLPVDQQDAAVRPAVTGVRKVVLSTDIAETSLTVDGVRVVVDAGLARAPRFDPRTGMTRLVTVSSSRASADQRAGRAGRTEPGVAVRLWSKVEHGARSSFTPAEIETVDLAGFVLETLAWGTSQPEHLQLLNPPPAPALREARELLSMLGALTGDGRLSSVGREMVKLPLHPRLARMVVGAALDDQGWLGCLIAALIDERDVLRGRPDELPTDLGVRLELLVDPARRHPQASGRSIGAARDRARDLARRIGVRSGSVDTDNVGAMLMRAYPDRIGQNRAKGMSSSGNRSAVARGRFRLRNGSGAWVNDTDPLAGEALIVAADLDGNRKDARIRMGAAIDQDDVMGVFGDQVQVSDVTSWNKGRNDLVRRVSRRLDSLDLGSVETRPEAGAATDAALLERVRATRLKVLNWTPRAKGFRDKVSFVRQHLGDEWPDMSDRALLADLEDWLLPFMPGATGRADLEMTSVMVALESRLTPQQRGRLPQLLPAKFVLPDGTRATIDYSGGVPTVSVRAQKLYGIARTPTVLNGALPITFELLSPANRPIQKTADLAGFWTGSWAEVRKDMAGRYPKHHWPKNPQE